MKELMDRSTLPPRRTAAVVLAILLHLSLGGLSACGVFETGDPLEGTFVLESISGQAVPATIMSNTVVMVAQRFEFRQNRTVQLTEVIRIVSGGQAGPEQTRVDQGFWWYSGRNVGVSTSVYTTEYAREDGGRLMRSVSHTFTGPGPSVEYNFEFVLRRVQ